MTDNILQANNRILTVGNRILLSRVVPFRILGEIVGTTAGSNFFGIDLDEASNRLFVIAKNLNALKVYNLSTNAEVQTITPGFNAPEGILVDGPGNRIFVANTGGTVTVLRLDTYAVITTLTGFSAARSLALDTATNRLFVVAGGTSNTVRVLNATTYAQLSTIACSTPYVVAISPQWNRLYIAQQTIGVKVLTLDTLQELTTIGGLGNTFGIAPDEPNSRILFNDGPVKVYDYATLNAIQSVTGTANGRGVRIQRSQNRFFSVDTTGNKVLILKLV